MISEVFFISALRQISGCHAGTDQDVQEGSLQDALKQLGIWSLGVQMAGWVEFTTVSYITT